MKSLLRLLLLAAVLPGAVAAEQSVSAAAQVRQMTRGVNIVGYDPLWKDPAQTRFQTRHMEVIRKGGFDTVRIVLQAFSHMDANNKLPQQWFATLDTLVQAALAQGLTVILDEHDFSFCGREPEACRIKLLAFWQQVSTAYAGAPDKVVFEILNEPHEKLNAGWNDLAADALTVIRKTNPDRNVIIGPNFWNSTTALKNLVLPKNDRHIIVTVHYYTPLRFTHQGASWAPDNKELGVTWGTAQDRAQIDKDFDATQAWSVANDRPIFLGEFGAYDKGPMESRIAYTSAVARAAEKRGWAWAYWQFDSDFIVYDIDKDRWVEPIHRALIPEKQ
ncbi:MAG TPA: glycoside hydrolase family 5 protein [Povalibacter sp.]